MPSKALSLLTTHVAVLHLADEFADAPSHWDLCRPIAEVPRLSTVRILPPPSGKTASLATRIAAAVGSKAPPPISLLMNERAAVVQVRPSSTYP